MVKRSHIRQLITADQKIIENTQKQNLPDFLEINHATLSLLIIFTKY